LAPACGRDAYTSPGLSQNLSDTAHTIRPIPESYFASILLAVCGRVALRRELLAIQRGAILGRRGSQK
jgi:hypothetical protein